MRTATADAVDAATVEELRAMVRALTRRVEALEGRADAPSVPVPRPAAPVAAPPVAPRPSPTPAQSTSAPTETAAAPGQFEVDEEAIERALEQALVRTGALLLPAGTAEIEPSLGYVRNEQDLPGLIAEDGQLATTIDQFRRDALVAGLTLRAGLPFDTQLEVAVPYLYEDVSIATEIGSTSGKETGQDAAGLGDVRLSLAKGLLSERGWWPNLIGQVEWDTDTGRTRNGVELGSGFDELTGSLTASKRQDPLVFVGTLAYTTSLEQHGIDPGDQVGLSLGTVLAASPQTALRFFLSQSFANETEARGREVSGSDQVRSSLILGASSTLLPRMLLDVSAGIGLTEDAPDYSIAVALPIRFDLPFRF
jgi:hypothetical protein